MNPALLCQTGVFGFIASVGLDAPDGFNQVAVGGGVARDSPFFLRSSADDVVLLRCFSGSQQLQLTMTIELGSSVVWLSSQRMHQLGVFGRCTRRTSPWPAALLLLAVLA